MNRNNFENSLIGDITFAEVLEKAKLRKLSQVLKITSDHISRVIPIGNGELEFLYAKTLERMKNDKEYIYLDTDAC